MQFLTLIYFKFYINFERGKLAHIANINNAVYSGKTNNTARLRGYR